MKLPTIFGTFLYIHTHWYIGTHSDGRAYTFGESSSLPSGQQVVEFIESRTATPETEVTASLWHWQWASKRSSAIARNAGIVKLNSAFRTHILM